ncbi:MAG: phage virion morphogenesis protein [Cyanobacteria bacterium SBC]|nr:phage virion morphogenesis protein [Cyanobacteria bacterium SBC]
MKIEVDTSQLDRIAGKLRDLSPVFQQIGAMADNKLQQTQSAGADPYGNTWKPKKTGEASFLRNTGDLEASRSWTAGGMEARVGYGAFYAKFHQNGTSKMVARPLVPEGDIPPDWQEEIQDIVDRFASSL